MFSKIYKKNVLILNNYFPFDKETLYLVDVELFYKITIFYGYTP